MKYMVVRIKDERSSSLCAAIEEYALQNGGLEFPFSFGGQYYDTNTAYAGVVRAGSIQTGTFHENCRCSLVPISSDTIFRYGRPDDLDMHMMLDSALSHTAMQELEASGEVEPEVVRDFSANRIMNLFRHYLSVLIKKVRNIQ